MMPKNKNVAMSHSFNQTPKYSEASNILLTL